MNITQTNKILNYADFVSFSPMYVETGTCYGQSIDRAIVAGFQRIKSVEMMPEFYSVCYERFKNNPSIELYLGKSTDMLPIMIKDLGYPAVFFLDAHPAGPGTGGHDEVISGNEEFGQHAIITQELKHILAHRNDHLIIIDDQNGVNEDNKVYMQMCLESNPNYKFEFYDENLSGDHLYKDKALVCVP